MTEHPTPSETSFDLSANGMARREAILTMAMRVAGQRRRRRRATRSATAVTALLLVVAGGVLAFRESHPTRPSQVSTAHLEGTPTPSPTPAPVGSRQHPVVTIARVRTEPGIAARLAVSTAARAAVPIPRVNDDELLARLADAGRPAGLAYVDDRPVLVFRDGDRVSPGSSRREVRRESVPQGL